MTDTAPCRRCGTPLVKAEYRRLVGIDNDVHRVWDSADNRMERRINARPHYENIPCPQCGDPAPLLRNKRQLALFFAVFFSIVAGLLTILFVF